MALGNVLGHATKPGEVRSAHYRDEDRYVVSLVATYGDALDGITTPQDAAARTLALTIDSKSDMTVWFVHDRETKETYAIEQGLFEDAIHEKGMI